jgi:hypothetical protein
MGSCQVLIAGMAYVSVKESADPCCMTEAEMGLYSDSTFFIADYNIKW